MASVSLGALVACAVPPTAPPGGTTSTTSAPTTTTTVASSTTTPPTSTTTTPTTITLPSTTTTTSPADPPAPAGAIVRATDSYGGEGGGDSYSAEISGDGRYVTFWSSAWNLVPDDPNAVADVYVWDSETDATVRVTNKADTYWDSTAPVISGDGGVVAFTSQAAHVAGDTNGREDVFVWDAATRTTIRITDGNGKSRAHGISGDGDRVLFSSWASDLVPDDTNGEPDLFVWDAGTGTTARVTDGGNIWTNDGRISGDGRYVVYTEETGPPVPPASDAVRDVFLWDAATGTTTRLTEGDAITAYPDVSDDGSAATFWSAASNLVPGETSEPGVFVWDAATGTTARIAGGHSPRISGDGRYVTWGGSNVHVWDATTGTVSDITDGNGNSYAPVMSDDGRAIAFLSRATDLVAGDRHDTPDVYYWSVDA